MELVAKGYGDDARAIIERAEAHGLPVREDPVLVEMLMHLDLYETVPPAVYTVLSELLLWLWRLDNEPDP